jgi:predicted DsbA family dithiol-disulfide isomerase
MGTVIDLEAARRRRHPASAADAVSTDGTVARRVSLRAHEHGVGQEFELALARLVKRWNQPVDALETLAQAAEVAGLSLDEVLDAAYDPRRDSELALRRAR